MLAFDPDSSVEENTESMTEALKRVSTSEITYAARDSDFDALPSSRATICPGRAPAPRYRPGHPMPCSAAWLRPSLSRTPSSSPCFTARTCRRPMQKALAIFQEACPKAEITLLAGGQPVYYYMISAE